MTEDLFIRLALLGGIAMGFSISAAHRRRAALVGGSVSNETEGFVRHLLLRACGLIALLSVVAYMIYPPAMSWAQLDLSPALRFAGVAIVWACLPAFYWVFRSLGNNVTGTVVTREAASLVTAGPYRWVRHPLYSMAMISWTGTCLATANGWIFFWIVAAFTILYRRTALEEAQLIERFGDAYRDYMRRTGRLVPRLVG